MSKTAWSETDSFQAAGLSFGAWAAVVAGLHLVLGLLLYEPTVFPGGDNADYMILGESLRSFEGYRDLHLPGSPIHTKYPPAYPTLLALLGWIAGVPLFKLASLALTTGTVWLTARWGQRLTGPVPALLAASLLAVNPVLLEYSHYVLSEALFTFLIMLCLITLEPGGMDRDRVDPGAANPEAVEHGAGWRIFALGLTAAALAFLTRTAGLALLIAVPVAAALARRSRHAVTAGLVTVATMAGWGLFQRAVAPDRASYLGQLVSRDPYDPAAGTINLAGLIERAALNAWTYVSEVLPASLTGSSGGSLLPWLGALMGSLALIGWASRLQRRVGPAEVFTVFYAGLIALWPSVWTDRRFLLPLLPLLIVYGLAAARTLLGHLPGGREASWARWGMAVLAVLLALPAARFVSTTVPERMACVAAYRTGTPCDPPAMASLYAAARWAAANTEPDAIIANRKPSLFFWFSGRQGDLYRYSTEPQLVLQGLEEMGAEYVVVDQVSGTTFRYLVPAIQEYRDRFQLVYEGGDPQTLIFRYTGAPVTAVRPEVAPETARVGSESVHAARHGQTGDGP